MTTKVGINGFGRIGRNFFRAARKLGLDLDFVAVNDITDAPTLAHLLKYDSVLGRFDGEVGLTADGISVDGDELRVLAVRDPAELPWKELGAQIVIESTGLFTDRERADEAHRGGRREGHHQRAGQGRGPDGRARRERRRVRPRRAQRDLQRVVYDELRRADGQGPRRRVRDRARGS